MQEQTMPNQKLLEEIAFLKQRIHDLESSLRKEHEIIFNGALLDSTERKQAEADIQNSETLSRSIIENIQDVFYRSDNQGLFLMVNLAGVQLFGYDCLKDMVGQSLDSFWVDPKDRERHLEAMRKYGSVKDFEGLLKKKDGTVFNASFTTHFYKDSHGNILGTAGIIRDITDRKQVETALKESERKYRQLAENMTDIVTVEDPQGIIVYTSPSHRSILGDNPENVIGKSGFDRVHPEDRDRVRTVFIEAIRTRTDSEAEFRYRHADGHYVWLRASGRALYNEEGHFQGQIICSNVITERIRAEEALKASEEKYRKIFENATEGIFQATPSGTYLNMNPAFASMFGYSSAREMIDSIVNIEQQIYVDPQGREQMMRLLLEHDKLEAYEFEARRKDGERFWLSTNIQTIRADNGNVQYFEGTATDITNRKRAEESLRESEKKFRDISEMMPQILFEIDTEGNLLFVNHATYELTGLSREDIESGVNVFDLVAREDVQRLIENKTIAAEKGFGVGNEYSIRKKDGGYLTGLIYSSSVRDNENKLIGFRGIVIDITERKKAEEASRQAEDKFSKIFMTTPDCIVISRIQDGKIVDVNRGFEDLSGWKREEVLGRYTPELNVWGNIADRDRMVNDLQAGRDILQRETVVRRKEGTLLNVIYSARPINISGESCLIFVMQDITDRRNLEEERRKLERQLFQAQKMEAIGTLAGGIAHDFNNILGAMMGYTELISYKTKDRNIYPYLEQILKACERSRDLVNQILTFSRRREQEKKPVSIIPIVKEALKLLRSSLPSTIEFLQRYDATQDTVLADPTQIHQVIMNLCTNASHAMRERRGALEVTLSQRLLSSADLSYGPDLKDGLYLQITVRDNGEGIDPAIKDKIFDPFFTTKVLGEGTGLGLSVVYGIVKDHGGVVSVESEVGKGTVFTILLPVIVIDGKPERQDLISVPGGKGSILYVDDEEPIAALGGEMLSYLGYDVTVRFSSHDALEVFRAHPESFDLVITDMTMPKMTGASLARELLKIRPGLSIILTTGFSERMSEEEAKQIGIQEFLMKPVSLPSLSQAVKRIFDKKDASPDQL